MAKVRTGSVALGLLALAAACRAATPTLDASLNEEVVRVPTTTGLFSVELETTIFKPPGAGPFPVLVMNHGKELGNPHFQARARYLVISREFVRRGYAVVIPMRRGFSQSSGVYVDGGCNIASNGKAQADDVQSAVEYVQKQPWADKERIVVGGQSHGGLSTLAFGTRNHPGVKGLINFAGGLRKENCRWQDELVRAMQSYGADTRLPSLWFYGANDSYFNAEVAARMHAAYLGAGGAVQLVAYGPFKQDAHGMAGSADGVAIWWPETEKFLQVLGLPTQALTAPRTPEKPEAPEKSDFALIDSVDAVPYLKDTGRVGYREFLGASLPRAFAIAPGGAWGWAHTGENPQARALDNCARHSKQACALYAIDDYVVWKEVK